MNSLTFIRPVTLGSKALLRGEAAFPAIDVSGGNTVLPNLYSKDLRSPIYSQFFSTPEIPVLV